MVGIRWKDCDVLAEAEKSEDFSNAQMYKFQYENILSNWISDKTHYKSLDILTSANSTFRTQNLISVSFRE